VLSSVIASSSDLGRPLWPPWCPLCCLASRHKSLCEPLVCPSSIVLSSSSLVHGRPRLCVSGELLAKIRRVGHRAPPVSGRAPLCATRRPSWPPDRGSMVMIKSGSYPFGRSLMDPWTRSTAGPRPRQHPVSATSSRPANHNSLSSAASADPPHQPLFCRKPPTVLNITKMPFHLYKPF
jgi:hypothetical protein